MNAPSDHSAFTPFNPNAKPPDELYLSRSWIGWRLEYDPENPDAKPKKMPVVLVEGVSVRDYLKPHAHVSYDEAVKAFVVRRHANGRRRLDGVGFVFTPEDNKLGGDLDKCRDPITGVVQEWAQEIIDRRETYFELSPSGTGVKYFALNHTPGRVVVKNNPAGVEVYSEKRFFTFTGDHVAGTPMELGQAPQAVAAMVQRDVDFKRGVKASPGSSASQSPSGSGLGDAQEPAGEAGAAAGDEDEGAKAFERHVSDKAFFRQVNDAALAKREKWVPKAFQKAKPPTSANSAWRIPSASIGRPDLVEDLSIHATGTTWYGVYDGEDAERKGKRTAINAILEHGPEDLRGSFDDMAAVMRVTLWLAEQLGLSDDDLKAMGWRGGETTEDPVDDTPPVDLWRAVDAPPLPVGLLPARVEAFVWANGKAIGGDPAGLAGASIAAMAAAIPDTIKLQVQAKGKKWLIAARIWIALLGGPSTKKTPIIKAALAALEKEDWGRRQHYTSRKALWEAQSKKQKADALAAGTQPPPHNRLMIGDATPEAAADILATSPNGVLAYHDELSGFFGQMERYGKNGADRPFWLQARDGGAFSIDRKSSGSTYIQHLSVTLVGGIQPEPMRKVAEGTADDGLIQRLTPIILRAAELTDDSEDTSAADQGFTDLIDALLTLTPGAQPLRFDDGAQKIRREMEIEHHERTQQWENIQKKIASAFGKQDGVFAELCVIWHAAENAGQNPLPEIVTEDTARRVATFMREFLRPHMIAFYRGALDLSDKHDELKMIAGYILAHKPETMNSREVQKSVWSMRRLGSREVASFMEQLEAFGWLFRHPPPRMGALPVWKVNPAIHAHFAEQAKVETERRAAARATIAKDVAARKSEQS